MKKEEILIKLTWLTDSKFRDLVNKGVITTVSKGSGKGKGRGTETATYANNSLDVLNSVRQLKYLVRNADLIYVILWEGHEVNYYKLHGRLFDDLDNIKKYLKQMTSLDDDEAIERLAIARLPKMKPRKPTNLELENRHQLIKHEIEKIHSEFEFIKCINNKLSISEIIQKLIKGNQVGIETANMFDEWASLEKWHSLIKSTTIDDLKQVHNSILILKKYMKLFKQYNPELVEQETILSNLKASPLLKIFTFLLLIPEVRCFIMGLNDLITVDTRS